MYKLVRYLRLEKWNRTPFIENLTVNNVRFGIQVTVKSLSPTFMRVALSEKLTGIVPPIHYSDIVLKHPERKFEEGRTAKARVRFDAASSKAALDLTNPHFI